MNAQPPARVSPETESDIPPTALVSCPPANESVARGRRDTDWDLSPTALVPLPPPSERPTSRLRPPKSPPPAEAVATAVAAVDPHPPVAAFPAVGDEYLGFELVSELGRGSFGRVYLARQTGLAGRPVALKVGVGLTAETMRLAQVDHPNVVPVYSFHPGTDLQAVCMPYLGPITLADVSRRIRTVAPTTLSGRLLTTVIDACRADKRAALPAVEGGPAAAAPVSLTALVGLRYTDAVLWIGRRLVAGLAAAHARQIVHCDLKPANVLLSDDGRPMLLDFGIALDRKAVGGEVKIGGTWPYMAPEQLASVRDGAVRYDERADLFAVGVILFELLAGRPPFPAVVSYDEAGLDHQLASRRDCPTVRSAGGRVPPAVEAILAKCLAFDPADRYQTAADLEDDLARQLARRPLRHAPNPSRRELAAKWAVRHRWALTGVGTAAAVGLSVAVMSAHNAGTAARLAAHERLVQADTFERAARSAQVGLGLAATTPAARQQAVRRAEEALADLGDLPAALPADRQAAVRARAVDLLLDLGRAAALAAPAGDGRQQALAAAADWNRRAEWAAGGAPPRAVLTQRAWLARQAGDADAAAAAGLAAAARPLATPTDLRSEGRELMTQGRLRQARGLLEQATRADSADFWAAFELAQCSYRLGYDAQAVAAYDRCAALDPDMPGVFFNRGLAYQRLRRHEAAAADFGRVIAANPDWPDPYLNRASAREALGDFPGAAADLTTAMEKGYPPAAALLARAQVYARMGNQAEAERNLRAGLAVQPTTEQEFLARGRHHMSRALRTKQPDTDAATAALAEFTAALAANPRSLAGLQLKSRALSALDRNREAADTLGELLGYYPETVHAWSGRAVLLARLGDRAAAHADADKALGLCDGDAATEYQLAGVYALTSRTDPADRASAFRLLASALRKGFGANLLAVDRDLDPLRSDPEFSRLAEANPAPAAAAAKK
jgi:serine/threonine protein kinase/regulator of sirC expression with transglutaminase-like and TPR domain